MWLAAEHGMFLRLTKGNWMTEMPENLHMDWVDSVKASSKGYVAAGPISNASVDVIQGRRSIEIRAVGVTKTHVYITYCYVHRVRRLIAF
ncbi:hypothetical protein CsSME_00031605 [Camellia sinensis var. sinensis]